MVELNEKQMEESNEKAFLKRHNGIFQCDNIKLTPIKELEFSITETITSAYECGEQEVGE